ncbi:MAG: class I SAM-dependent methyltransferase [bacterium]|nr:class I SAM-dependent methyltransferase [bacterium]
MSAWYEEWFGDDYVRLYTHRDEEESVEFMKTLKKTLKIKREQKILDLCCGAGRYSIELAKRGYKVTGIDLSEELIMAALNKAEKNGLTIDFLIRDMRNIQFTEHFDGVVNMFTSFGYFKDDEENEKVIKGVADSLKHKGWFVLDFMNREFILNNLHPYDESEYDDIKVVQKKRFDNDTGRIEKEILITRDGIQKGYLESVRLYSVHELRAMFERNGFDIYKEFGDYNGTEHTGESPRVIITGIKQ